MSSQQSGEGEIRKAMIEAGAVDCMVALPGQLFYSTQIPACLWILAKDRSNGLVKNSRLRDRRSEILFIDARNMGVLVDRTRRELTDRTSARLRRPITHGVVRMMRVSTSMCARLLRLMKCASMVCVDAGALCGGGGARG